MLRLTNMLHMVAELWRKTDSAPARATPCAITGQMCGNDPTVKTKGSCADRMHRMGLPCPRRHKTDGGGPVVCPAPTEQQRGHLPPCEPSPQTGRPLPPSVHLPRAESQETVLQEQHLVKIAQTLQTFTSNLDELQRRIDQLITFCLAISCEECPSWEKDHNHRSSGALRP